MKTFVKKHTMVEGYCAAGIGTCPELEAPFDGEIEGKVTCESKRFEEPIIVTVGGQELEREWEHVESFPSTDSTNGDNLFALSFICNVKAGDIISILPTEHGRVHTWVIDYLEKETGND